MSTVFCVYTTTSTIPSFNEVLTLSNKYLVEILKKHRIYDDYLIDVCIIDEQTDEVVPLDKSSPAVWSIDNQYAWFTVNEQPGGCDAYVNNFSDYSNFEQWYIDFIDDTQVKVCKSKLKECFESGLYWEFRRSAGQPAIINLSYGLIAAAFTELTNGLIYSDDGAWDYAIFPTSANHFLQNFFNLQYSNPEYANWAEKCIDIIRNGGKKEE